MLYRHGDVLIEKVRTMPEDSKKQQHLVLAEGELTGHCHRIQEEDAATLYRSQSRGLFLRIDERQATVVHEEHGPIELPRGLYRVWQQREYSPQRISIVRD